MAKKAKRRLVEGAVNAASDYLPDVVEGPLRRLLGMSDLAVKPNAKPTLAVKPRQLALPAPPRQLALPAPGPGLPPLASKPRGGQFWPDRSFDNSNMSPEASVRRTRQGDPSLSMLTGADFDPGTGQGAQLGDWLERTLAKYYKTDFGAPEDPLRDLAERGLHYDPEMTPERWRDTVNSYLQEDPIGAYTVPGTSGYNPVASQELLAAAPWLAKQPVTDNIYGINQGGLDLSHFTDEMRNAMDVASSGLPSDLAVRPESLGRMSFPQAVEHVGRINQYRAKEMERAALGNLNSPAVQTFKEYPENNPMGLRWTELKTPELTDDLLTDSVREAIEIAEQQGTPRNPNLINQVKSERAEGYLQDALKYEGDTMGHCVGGYCDDVMEGRSRIFSLRDAKGEPHVTIETKPYTQWLSLEHAADTDPDFGDAWNDWRYGYNISRMPGRPEGTFEDHLRVNDPDLLSRFEGQNYAPDEIVQIKGKQNRAPKDDYLPFVQDFVKSQQWGNVGDLRNTQLVKLPDGRYITTQQADEGIAAIPERIGPEVYDPSYLHSMGPDVWAKIARHFEGFAIGGRVSADRCFTRSPLSVR